MTETVMIFGDLPESADISPFQKQCGPDGSAADAVAVFPPDAQPADIQAALARIGKPLAPIADFTNTGTFRRDITGSTRNIATISSAMAELHFLTERHKATAELPPGADHTGLTCLGIAHTRKQAICPEWRPQMPQTLWYPSVGHGRDLLEDLANAGLFRRQFARRLHFCGNCDSHRLQVFEACTSCGSGFLDEESIVHHFSCGEQGPESQFLQGHDLICPKCTKELRHFGIDYARPGQLLICKACDTSMSEPETHFICMDCNETSLAEQLDTRDWYSYELTDDGVEAVLRQRLPAVTFDDFLAPHDRAFTRREFILLALAATRQAERYNRPLTVARITLKNYESLRIDLGSAAADEAISLVIDLLVEQLRETDFFTNTDDDELLVFLPETDRDQSGNVLSRFTKRVAENVAGRLSIDTEFIEGSAITSTLEALS